MTKRGIFLSIFFVISIIVLFFYVYEDGDGAVSKNTPAENGGILEGERRVGKSVSALNFEGANSKCNVGTDKKLISDGGVKSIKEINSSVDGLLEKNSSNITEIVKNARAGEAVSSIALFRIVATCYSIKNNQKINSSTQDCADVDLDLVSDRFGILERAANKGSLEAKLIYAMNASSLSKFYSRLATNEAVIYADGILKKSEIFGREAAEGGFVEAYLFMSRAYSNGLFGVRDPQLAYAFALPMANGEIDDVERRYITSLGSKLSLSEKEGAEKIAFGCKEEKEPMIFQNPFKMN
ncbi:hypothetical protein O3297_09065 [Janthinobacterium sp. SUN128]|uniref:hypothetical protein n=1 Tax=Janthinobacterium sp. SUN128 TaxID=3014790 RepID=UPI0027134709|nr:hypothetical protein [Janthinobacterium sp. SUN128]MDO8033565.1 hypothetical protein [Janthinobacterium sp. SUN128]